MKIFIINQKDFSEVVEGEKKCKLLHVLSMGEILDWLESNFKFQLEFYGDWRDIPNLQVDVAHNWDKVYFFDIRSYCPKTDVLGVMYVGTMK